MPQSSPFSSRKTSKGSKTTQRPLTPEYNNRKHLNMSPKALVQAKKMANSRNGGTASFERKRRASSSSVSSVSSVSSLEELSEEADDSEDDADDEEDRPLAQARSFGRRWNNSRKAGRQAAKATKRIRVSEDEESDNIVSSDSDSEDSSDDVYAAVDYITDAEDEEQDVEKLEEMMIMQSEREHRILPTSETSHDQWHGAEIFGDSMFLPAASFFDEEQIYSAMDTFGEPEIASEPVETSVARRVHFEERSDSSSDSDSHTEDEIPSDFLQQDSLDPQLRRMIESDNDHHRSHRRQSEDMFGDADYGHGNIYHVESEGTSEGSLSGYETDHGDTTDEDLPPPATITHPRSLLRRDSTDSLVATDDKSDTIPRRRGPIMGTFVADPHKPVALVDCTGKHLVIIPAYASSRHDWLDSAANSMPGTANNSPRQTTLQLIDESDTDALASPNQTDFSPMLASSANLMMTALGNDLAPGGQVMGPPEAFYPSRDFAIDSSFEEDDEDDPESALNVDDFIDFGNGSSDEDDMGNLDDDALISPMTGGSSLPNMGTPTPKRNSDVQQDSKSERFLEHLDKGIVTAFRRNHNRYQALLRLPQHREFMPANSPARPASVFRHAKHTDQRTPTRKRKASGYTGGEAVRRKLMDAQRRTQVPL
ncbi:uncharacterized protein N7484_006122 [Penicillium longicatenatum]|uniref:uncharacterized protein n=1 Tax=Penicillium longicatenatum TaxID=1561947 RepID=UPI002546E013|nr:uncharacterized protein N7484_006122 [Penicillium longicatenatum]KAJ5643615.1 hypothetical protein N7484_006122 [Penicillium longicatenatum]KAJ5645020.1 hypothetical protein N7507_011031 [Penicillium longicatenatum]